MSTVFNNYKFAKPWYRQSEITDLLSISNTTLKRYMSEHTQKGGLLADMGHLEIDGFREACWEPIALVNWIYNNKVNKQRTYDYEFAEAKKLEENIVNIKQRGKN